jgi:hypothetical protein
VREFTTTMGDAEDKHVIVVVFVQGARRHFPRGLAFLTLILMFMGSLGNNTSWALRLIYKLLL